MWYRGYDDIGIPFDPEVLRRRAHIAEVPECETHRHHREWAEGLVKYPQKMTPKE